MEQRDQLISHSQELDSTIAQLKAKDGNLAYSDGIKGTGNFR